MFAQHKNLTVRGDVTDTTGMGVLNCTVTLSGSQDGLIYSHFNMGNSNAFKVDIDPRQNDSLIVEIEHLSFSPFKKTYFIKADVGTFIIKLSATLHQEVRNLKEVNITPPSTWKRGDTTFYQANSYKEGDEKKLKDLLLKLPDFKWDVGGQITYKNKPIDKITVDGEELLADKIELLLNNFPIHVLNTIQVIENQSSRRLLKGLSGENKTFVNLQINKKNRLSAGFGEVDVGLGNRGQYNFSPVLFSIYSRVKVGFIGNYNSIGNGVGLQQEGELRNAAEQDAQQLLMGNHTLYHINNFEQRWYIKNRQWDNRLQINTPFSKTTHSQTEINYVVDRQPQQIYDNSFLLNSGNYQQRTDTSTNLYKPSILSLKQTFKIEPDSVHDLKIILNFYDNQSIGQQLTIFRGFGIASPLAVSTQTAWTSLTLSTDYSIRHSPHRASTFFFLINNQNLGQSALGESTDIASIFSLHDGYNRMLNQIQTEFTTVQGIWKLLLRNKKNYLTNFGFSAECKEIGLNQSLNISQNSGNLPPVNLSGLTNLSSYAVSKLTATFARSFSFLLNEPFVFSTELGLAHYSPKSNSSISQFSTFIAKGTLTNDHKISEVLHGGFNADIYQWQLQPELLNNQYYPSSALSFNRHLNTTLPLRKFEARYVLTYIPNNDLTTFSLYATGALIPNGIVPYNAYKAFISFVDSYLLSQSTNKKNIAFSVKFPSLLLNALIDLNASYSTNRFVVLAGNQLLQGSLNFTNLYFSFKKNWNRKYFIRFTSDLSTNVNHLSNTMNSTDNKVSSLKNSLYQRILINKQMNLVANLNLYNNNLFTPNKAIFKMADLEWNCQWKQLPLYFSLKADNLFNENNFYNFSNSVFAQSFTTIPLRGRSIFASARFTF